MKNKDSNIVTARLENAMYYPFMHTVMTPVIVKGDILHYGVTGAFIDVESEELTKVGASHGVSERPSWTFWVLWEDIVDKGDKL